VAVQALLASGRARDAETIIGRVSRGLVGRHAPLAEASLSISSGFVSQSRGNHAGAAAAYSRADRQYADLLRPYDAALAAESRGRCLFEVSDPAAAVSLIDALRRFGCLGALGDERRVRRYLRAQRISIPRAARRRMTPGADLSWREQQVVHLAASGRTASEISEALRLSRRTVEQYLRFALRKLGVRHKRDLVRSAGAETSALSPMAIATGS
jgi:DNA-binding CsgD family transcriptional regulator